MSHTILEPGEKMPLIPWNNFECDYCQSLVMSCATRDVPEQSIASYLDTQIAGATRDRQPEAVAYLNDLRRYWLNSARYLRTDAGSKL